MTNNDKFTECEVIHVEDTGIVFAVTVTYSTDSGKILSTDFEGVIDAQ